MIFILYEMYAMKWQVKFSSNDFHTIGAAKKNRSATIFRSNIVSGTTKKCLSAERNDRVGLVPIDEARQIT